LVKTGIIGESSKLSPRGGKIPAWNRLSEAEKEKQDLRMATYAAMVDCVDQNIGKIVRSLKELDVYENTVILFLSDNGGDAGGGVTGSDTGKGTCGTAESHVKYGECWANVCDTPFRRYKAWLHEGGVATPLIAHWPKGIPPELHGTLVTEPTHVIDLMATCVDLSGGEYPETYKGNQIIPMAGKSLRPLLEGRTFSRENPIYFNLGGSRAMRKGKWKLISVKGGPWELYDMQTDRTELNNLAAALPEKVKELSTLYGAWSDQRFVTTKNRKAKK
jgi:arylsulfatase